MKLENLNKICSSADWHCGEFQAMLRDIVYPNSPEIDILRSQHHRKHWEWTVGMLALKRAGKLDGNSICLGIGSGAEPPVFYLTNNTRYVFCTDLYTIAGKWNEDFPDMLSTPEKFAPGEFNRRKLGVMNMNGTNITFEDNTFDVVFSYSSIEHFGSKDAVIDCMHEIARVLKPGGIVSITTELFIGDPNQLYHARECRDDGFKCFFKRYDIYNEMFTRQELSYIIETPGLELVQEIDFNIDANDIANIVKYPSDQHEPHHIFLNLKGIRWGSIHIVMRKV